MRPAAQIQLFRQNPKFTKFTGSGLFFLFGQAARGQAIGEAAPIVGQGYNAEKVRAAWERRGDYGRGGGL